MGISSAGLGSGLDVNGLVTQLLALERQPLNSLTQKKKVIDGQVSAFGRVKSDLDAFKTAVGALRLNLSFQGTKATSSNTDLMTATTGIEAASGSYDIKINRLAQADVSVAKGKSSLPSAAIGGAGVLAFAVGEKSFSINVDAADTLDAVKNKINSAIVGTETSPQSLGKASVINTGTAAAPAYQLVVSSSEKGVDNKVSISVSGDDAFQSYFGMDIKQPAENAKFVVNGVEVERASNTVTDVIDGVTLNLLTADPLKTLNVTVARDTEAITKKVNDFLSAYNKLAGTVSSLHQKGGTLEADNSTKSVIYGLQNEFNQAANIAGNAFGWLAEVGISFKKDGTLALDSAAFTKALESKYNDVVNLFTNAEKGFAHRLFNTAANMLDTNGLVSSRISGMNTRIKTIDVGMERENLRLTNVETRLRAQYAKLDAALGTMKNTSNYLASQLR